VKFQPDIPILMIMGRDLSRYGRKTGVRVKIVENDVPQLQTPKTLKLSRANNNELFMD
jgi:hypothetical protein